MVTFIVGSVCLAEAMHMNFKDPVFWICSTFGVVCMLLAFS
jgi:uncharacterized membrane protein